MADTQPLYRAPQGPSIAVVAAKVDEGIIRAIDPINFGAYSSSPVNTAHKLVNSILRYIGSLRTEVEWTGYTYGSGPGYLYYAEAEGWTDMRAVERPAGVWLWKWQRPPDGKLYPLGVTQRDGVRLGGLS